MAVLGIFLCVVPEVCMARFLLPGLKGIGLDAATANKFGQTLFFGLLTVGRIGGAIVPLVMGGFMDTDMKVVSFIVPCACFVYLFVLSLRGGQKSAVA